MHSGDSNSNKLYDLTTIYAICDRNPQFLDKLIKVFAENVLSDLETMKNGSSRGDWSEVGQVAHKMKPSLNHFGINSLKDTILTLEHPVNVNQEQLAWMVVEVERVVHQVLEELKVEFPNVLV